jgi:hypothetical protein
VSGRALKGKRRRPITLWCGFALAASLLFGASACSVLGAPSKVHAGELYASGSKRYDAYFEEVHALQVAAATWPKERVNARKPLVDALKLAADADDATIAQSTKDRLNTGLLRLEVKGTDVHVIEGSAAAQESPREVLSAVELTAHAEVQRANQLADLPTHSDNLSKTGHELEAHIAEDFAGEGQKPFEVKEELHASYDVLSDLKDAVVRERRAADQLVAELGRAVSTGSEIPTAPAASVLVPKGKPPKTPSKPEAKPAPRSATIAHAEPVAPSPKPASPPPKPAAKSSDTEVFNP